MSKTCAKCDKTSEVANHVSHSKRHVLRRQSPNLQLVTVNGKKMRVCSSCRRTLVKNA